MRQWWRPSLASMFDPAGFHTAGTQHLPRPSPDPGPPRLGVLRWPTGASRWATFWHLVRDDQLAAIRTSIGGTPAPATLSISDGRDGYEITPAMWMLPPVPVCDVLPADLPAPGPVWPTSPPTAPAAANRLWLICLVDDRYWWWRRHGTNAMTATPATWADFFASLLTQCGATGTADPIPSAYKTPTGRWVVGAEPWPVLLDAAAASVGCRVVRGLDGTVKVRRAVAARGDLDSNWTLWAADVIGGGRLSRYDLGRAVPAKVASIFYASSPAAEVAVSVALSSITGGAGVGVGVPGGEARVWPDMAASASSGDRTACAGEAAADYYRWAVLPDVAATFRGAVPWEPTGLEGFVEWETGTAGDGERVLTRVILPPQPALFGGSLTVGGGTPALEVVYATADNDGTSGVWTAGTVVTQDGAGLPVLTSPPTVYALYPLPGHVIKSGEYWEVIRYTDLVQPSPPSPPPPPGSPTPATAGVPKVWVHGGKVVTFAIPDMATFAASGSGTCNEDGSITVTIGSATVSTVTTTLHAPNLRSG